MEGVFSLKQYIQTMNVQAVTFGIPRDILEQIFGENDITI